MVAECLGCHAEESRCGKVSEWHRGCARESGATTGSLAGTEVRKTCCGMEGLVTVVRLGELSRVRLWQGETKGVPCLAAQVVPQELHLVESHQGVGVGVSGNGMGADM